MKTRVAINGFGRIGRNAFKVAFDREDLEIVAINDITDTKTLAHLLKHDSNYGAYKYDVGHDDTGIIVNGKHVTILAVKDPSALPWEEQKIDVVIESTGLFVDPEKAKGHIAAGAKKVVLSAPAKGDGATTVVLGVNEDKLATASDIISNASCTTNCITPVAAVIESAFGIDKAMMTTIHSYTASQKLQDAPAKDLREARNAAENIVPTTTGASKAAAKAMPALEGIFGGMSIRVPTPVVSLSDFVIITKKPVTVESVNDVFKKAAAEPFYQGILAVSEEELVSSDYIGNSHSAIIDLKLTAVIGDNMLKVVAWYDNEWGYSNRLIEVVSDVGKLLNKSTPAPEPPKPTDNKTVEVKSENTPVMSMPKQVSDTPPPVPQAQVSEPNTTPVTQTPITPTTAPVAPASTPTPTPIPVSDPMPVNNPVTPPPQNGKPAIVSPSPGFNHVSSAPAIPDDVVHEAAAPGPTMGTVAPETTTDTTNSPPPSQTIIG